MTFVNEYVYDCIRMVCRVNETLDAPKKYVHFIILHCFIVILLVIKWSLFFRINHKSIRNMACAFLLIY